MLCGLASFLSIFTCRRGTRGGGMGDDEKAKTVPQTTSSTHVSLPETATTRSRNGPQLHQRQPNQGGRGGGEPFGRTRQQQRPAVSKSSSLMLDEQAAVVGNNSNSRSRNNVKAVLAEIAQEKHNHAHHHHVHQHHHHHHRHHSQKADVSVPQPSAPPPPSESSLTSSTSRSPPPSFANATRSDHKARMSKTRHEGDRGQRGGGGNSAQKTASQQRRDQPHQGENSSQPQGQSNTRTKRAARPSSADSTTAKTSDSR